LKKLKVKKQVPATKESKAGAITVEAPIHYSNLALIDPVDGFLLFKKIALQF
jgi:ribosomal protein L24